MYRHGVKETLNHTMLVTNTVWWRLRHDASPTPTSPFSTEQFVGICQQLGLHTFQPVSALPSNVPRAATHVSGRQPARGTAVADIRHQAVSALERRRGTLVGAALHAL